MFLNHFICNVNYLSWLDPSEAILALSVSTFRSLSEAWVAPDLNRR